MAEDRDSSRLGKAVEHLVAASCILASGLELNVSTSFVDDEGVDLVFHRRGTSTTLAVQVKCRTLRAKTIVNRQRFRANVSSSTFRPRADLYMLFVVVDQDEGTFNSVWLVPSNDFAKKTKTSNKKRLIFSASMKPETKDQWSMYRCERAALPQQLLEILDGLAKRR